MNTKKEPTNIAELLNNYQARGINIKRLYDTLKQYTIDYKGQTATFCEVHKYFKKRFNQK